MSIIKNLTKEQYEAKCEEYKRRARPLNEVLFKIYAFAVPTYIIKNGDITCIYPPEVQEQVNKIKGYLKEISESVFQDPDFVNETPKIISEIGRQYGGDNSEVSRNQEERKDVSEPGSTGLGDK